MYNDNIIYNCILVDIMNFFEFNKKFATELDCINYFIKIRYSIEVKCNHCSSNKVFRRNDNPKFLQCNSCNNSFSVFKGTIFEKSDTDLRKWFYAIHLFLNSKKGISGYQLQREIGVTYKCAWRILHLIRKAMGNEETKELIGSLVEVDEAYVATEDNDDDQDNKPKKRGRGANKNVVVACVDRENKKVLAQVMHKNIQGQKLTGKQLLDMLSQVVLPNSTIISDEFKGYNIIDKTKNYTHLTVNHSKGYVGLKGEHINNVESFWGTLKRGIIGIYHHVSTNYLQSYVDEFCFRSNNRTNCDVFNLLLKQAVL